MKNLFVSAALGALAISAPVAAESLEETAGRFGIRETVLSVSLSPSGNKVAFLSAGPEHSEVLNVVDLAGDGQVRVVTRNTEQNGDLTRCDWATEERLVCQLYGIGQRGDGLLLSFTRMFAIDDDGQNGKMLSERASQRAMRFAQQGGALVALDVEGEPGSILMTREWVKDRSIGTRLANSKEGYGVELIDASNGRRKVKEQPDISASRFIADENGVIRLKVRSLSDGRGYLTGERVFMYRGIDDNNWRQLDDISIGGEVRKNFRPVAVDAKRNVIFGFDVTNGFDAVAEVPIDDLSAGRYIVSRTDVDVDNLIRIGRQQRVVGASYATEKRTIAYFDSELQELADALGKALPNKPLVNIVGASADENRLLLIASSDKDPGTVYLYDKSSRQLQPLLAMREALVNRTMGSVKPITYAASDGTPIPGYLTLPPGSDGTNLPAVVLPHGGPAARDEWGFDWLPQFLVARGYAVLQPNYRGSSGYGEAWYGKNGYQAWPTAIGDVNDAGKWLIEQGIADPEKLAILGWSYGGYAALQSQVVDPDLFKAVVAIAPVTDLGFLRSDARGYTSAQLRDEQLGEGPHIAAGSPLRHADRFKAPVALFHGDYDLNVDVRHSRAMEDRLEDAGKQVTYTEYEGLEHSLRDSRVRTEMLTKIDEFLAGALGN